MEPLVNGNPGQHECWEELAEHALTHDDLSLCECWANPLNRDERRKVADLLARACSRFYNTPAGTPRAMLSQIVASAEMSDLHLDVTERAEVATS